MTTYRALFLFAGLGGGALGFARARAAGARFDVAGAVDFDAAAARDFEALTGRPCTVADLATMTPEELRAACPGGAPDVVFTSPPCKSFSACLPSATAATPKYVDMADLAVRGLFLTLEAWERKPRLILLENVPRIQVRGRHLLDVIVGMLRSYGYAVRETVHDCGELGGLAQRRRRFLLVARHVATTGDWWREPVKRRVRGVGEVLGELPLPLPSSTDGGPMHRLPRLSALNWLRLALIPAGGDWRDLPAEVRLAPRAGRLNGGFGVESWGEAAHAVVAEGTVRNTWASVADPRPGYESRNGHHVQDWHATAKTVIGHDPRGLKGAAVADPRFYDGGTATGGAAPSTGGRSVDAQADGQTDRGGSREALPSPERLGSEGRFESGPPSFFDPRLSAREGRHESKYRVEDGDGPAHTVTGADRIGSGAPSVADPRLPGRFHGEHGVDGWTSPAGTVLGSAVTSKGANVADPRLTCEPRNTVLGVVAPDAPAGAVLGAAAHDNGAFSVADPRVTSERNEGGHGVVAWDRPAYCLIGHPTIHNWPGQVADPRAAGCQIGRVVQTPDGLALVGVDLDLADARPLDNPPIILALDGTWHRPMTTLELAALQSLPVRGDDGAWLVLDGRNNGSWRERIGNAVPVDTAEAIAGTALSCLMSSDAGAVTLGFEPVWVGPEREALQA